MRKINKIIVHCSDTPLSRPTSIDEIRDWHINGNGWSDIGYHWYIDQYGKMHVGRPEPVIGAHCRGHNRDSIGVCLEGRGEYTEAQFDALFLLITEIIGRHGIKLSEIYGHRDFDSGKECPLFEVRDKLKEWSQ